jgi:hypothetical protein
LRTRFSTKKPYVQQRLKNHLVLREPGRQFRFSHVYPASLVAGAHGTWLGYLGECTRISLNYDSKFVNTKPDLFYKREFAANATGSQLGHGPKDACDINTRTTRLYPFSAIRSNTTCFLDACMSKVRTVIVSVGIEAPVRPICGKGRARADDRRTFPLLLFN